MASNKAAASLVLSCAVLLGSASGRKLQASPCTFATLFSVRSEWESVDDPCHKKLPFELWTLMKAEGSAQSSDALHVRENCIHTTEVGLLELITPKGYAMSESVEAAPGAVVSETEHATTYQGATAATFEAFCEDDDIVRVARVSAYLQAHNRSTKKNPRRRLQSTTSEGGPAHEVAELIAGLADLGCTRTMGEDQTVCVMSDSFNQLGLAADLQASGDLPLVEVVKDLPITDQEAQDEGSAMLEIMYDIAPGATYKFNTAFMGEQTYADDVSILANEEMCDIVVDDVTNYAEPAYRDGIVAIAVDEAVDAGGLHFTSAGNSETGWKFMSNFECATDFETEFDLTPACGTGVATHVFNPDITGPLRYMYPFFAETEKEYYVLHWDAEIGTTQDIWIALWIADVNTGERVFVKIFDDTQGGAAVERLVIDSALNDDGSLDQDILYLIQVIHLGLEVDDIDAEFLMLSPYHPIKGESDEVIYGHSCATNAVTVAAMEWVEGDGLGGAFEDPETSPVEEFSSRGPCVVNGEVRAKPTTTAADGVTTSNPFDSLATFFGTSAAAPAAGAIASIVRAACFPKVVGHAEIMEMLTNYDYTIDLTSDADGAAETWGREGGYGIISASQMLAWVAANCGEACPGAASPSTTEEPVVPTAEPTAETPEPTGHTPAPAMPTPSPEASVAPDTPAPVEKQTPTTPAPVREGTPTTPGPVEEEPPATPAPEKREEPETPAPEDSRDGYVEAGTKTTVSVTATAWDERPGEDRGDSGCGETGCLPDLAHDGVGEEDVESRWSCSKGIVPDGGQCKIEFTFGSPEDIVDMEVDFWKGDERTRTLKVKLDGHPVGKYDSHPGSITTSLGIKQDGVETVTLESIGIGEDEWISLLEVRFMVEP